MTALPVASGSRSRRWLRTALRVRPRQSLAVVALCLTTAVCAVIPVLALGILVDRVSSETSAASLIPLALTAAGAAVVGGLSAAATVWAIARLGADVIATLRTESIDAALRLPRGVLEDAGRGDLLSRVNSDVTMINRAVTTVIPTVVTATALAGVSLIAMAGLDWRLGVAGAVSVPLYALALRWYIPRSSPVFAAERAAAADRAHAIVEAVSGRDTVHAYALRDAEIAEIESRSATTRDLAVSAFTLFTRLVGRVNRAEFAGLSAILIVGFWLVDAGEISVGATTAAALLFHRLFNPIGMILYSSAELQLAGAGLARLVGVADCRPEVDDRAGQKHSGSDHSDGLVLRDIHFAYPTGRPVLRGVTLRIDPGQRLALVGSSGAGKSTLAGIVDGALSPDRGEVVRAADARVFTVSQEVHVFAGPLLADLRLAAPDADRAAVMRALQVVGADAWVEALPDGLDTVVGEGGHRLSDAQAQQVALARLVLADPQIAVLDEATAEADSDLAVDLDRAAVAATRGRTTLIIAHRLTQALTADVVAVIRDGTISEHGPPHELIAAGGELSRLWATAHHRRHHATTP
ncbi:ABC transporter ATP-binding protein [Gordonia sp. NPDC003424]